MTHSNADGSSRQKILSRCEPGEPLTLQHDSQNPVSKTAIKVLRGNGEMLGYLPSEVSTNPLGKPLAEKMAVGYRLYSRLTTVTGRDKNTLGANIEVAIWTGSVDTQPESDPEFAPLAEITNKTPRRKAPETIVKIQLPARAGCATTLVAIASLTTALILRLR